jgi:hypothetical protein
MRKRAGDDNFDKQHKSKKIRIGNEYYRQQQQQQEEEDILKSYNNEIQSLAQQKEHLRQQIEILEEQTQHINSVTNLVEQRKHEYLKSVVAKNGHVVTTINNENLSILSPDVILYILQYYELVINKEMIDLKVLVRLLFGYFDTNRVVYTVFSSVYLDYARSHIVNSIIRIHGIKCLNIQYNSRKLIMDLAPETPQVQLLNIDTAKYIVDRPAVSDFVVKFYLFNLDLRVKYNILGSSPNSVLYSLVQENLPQHWKQSRFGLIYSRRLIQLSNRITITQTLNQIQPVRVNNEIDIEIILKSGAQLDHIEKLQLIHSGIFDSKNYTILQFICTCPKLIHLTSICSKLPNFSTAHHLRYVDVQETSCSILSTLSNLNHLRTLKCILLRDTNFNLNPNITDLQLKTLETGELSNNLISSIFTSKIRRLSLITRHAINPIPSKYSNLIESNTSITNLSVINHKFWIDCLPAVLQNSNIRLLTISGWENDTSHVLVKSIENLMTVNEFRYVEHVESLSIQFINDTIADHLARRATNLSILSIHNTHLSVKAMSTICTNLPSLTQLTLDRCQVTDEMLVWPFLNTNLTYLDLRGNVVTLQETSIYQVNTTIKTLILANNKIKNDAIIQLLKQTSFTHLDLSYSMNRSLDKEEEKAISQNKNLYSLTLGYIPEHDVPRVEKAGAHIPIFKIIPRYSLRP